MIKRLATALAAAGLIGLSLGSVAYAQDADEGPVSLGGRVEVPEMGYALTAPDEWITIHPTADDADAIIDSLSAIDPDLAATTEQALAGGVNFSLLTFGEVDADSTFRENCNVLDYPAADAPLEDILAAEAAAFVEMGDRLASGPETTILELAAGEVGRIDYGLQYPTLESIHAAYYYSDGTTSHLLTCTGLERPEDDWLSIAETFEFLDDEE